MIDKEERPKFTCPYDFKCLNEDGVCPRAPVCEGIIKRFGMHERIVDFFYVNARWDDLHYYLQDLLSGSFINCDVDAMEEIRANNPDSKDIPLSKYPPGCRVFKISNLMKEKRRLIRDYERLKQEREGSLSKKGEKDLDDAKQALEEYADKILDILKHLVVDERYKHEKEEFYYKKLGELYEYALEAKKQGQQVQDGMGQHLEQGFVNAAKGAGLREKDAKRNREKVLKVDREFKKKQKEKEKNKEKQEEEDQDG